MEYIPLDINSSNINSALKNCRNNKTCKPVWYIFWIAIKKISVLYKIIIKAVRLLDKLLLNLNFLLTYKNNKWWKCLLSGLNGDFLNLIFLIIENNISNAGYQNNNAIKYGDKSWLLS